jgi:hypothetical protein
MIIWGGDGYAGTGGGYDPATDTWTATSLANAPNGRGFHAAVWTGSEMIVWGGGYSDGIQIIYLDSGGRYDPTTDTWASTSLANAPNSREFHTGVWTGTELIVWGGEYGDGEEVNWLDTGGRYCAGRR